MSEISYVRGYQIISSILILFMIGMFMFGNIFKEESRLSEGEKRKRNIEAILRYIFILIGINMMCFAYYHLY